MDILQLLDPPQETKPACPSVREWGIFCNHLHPFDPNRWCPGCSEDGEFEEWIEANDPHYGDGEWPEDTDPEWEGVVR